MNLTHINIQKERKEDSGVPRDSMMHICHSGFRDLIKLSCGYPTVIIVTSHIHIVMNLET